MPLTSEDVEQPQPSGDVDRVVALANRLRAEQRAVVAATTALQNALAEYNRTAEVELPEAMSAAGISEWPLRLLDGKPVRLETRLVGGQLSSEEGLAYVEASGGEALVKTRIEIEMDRGDLPQARALFAELRDHRLANQFKKLELNSHVHSQTLCAWARELIEQGRDPDLDKIGVHRRVRAVLGDRRPKQVDLKGFTER